MACVSVEAASPAVNSEARCFDREKIRRWIKESLKLV
jgi:hypothetical protein